MKIEQPNRATRTCTQRLAGTPDAIFPLPCPVREADCVDGNANAHRRQGGTLFASIP